MSLMRQRHLSVPGMVAIGGSAVGAGLLGFYYSLYRHQQKKDKADQSPHWEKLIAHVGMTSLTDTPTVPASRVESRFPPAPAPAKEHHSGHSTIANYYSSPSASHAGRRLEPAPQRAKDDGSGRAYTKSPDYVHNYEKTTKAKRAKEAKDEVAALA